MSEGKEGLGGGVLPLPWQMEATPRGDVENILPQVQKQSSFTRFIILSAAVTANINTMKLLIDSVAPGNMS